jgi:DNA-binding CsgD family transcriptional regulator
LSRRRQRPIEPPRDLQALESEDGTVMVLSFALTPGGARPLTVAESEVAAHMLDGRSNAEIARLRFCSERTIANQVSSVFSKLGVRSRLELLVLAPLVNVKRP